LQRRLACDGDPLRVQQFKAGPALNDLIGGQFDFMCDQTLNVLQPVRGGLIKAYAATTKKRLVVLPELPTAAESGLPGFEITVSFGMRAPKGTPKPVIDTLSVALQEALKSPEVKDRLAAAGAETVVRASAAGGVARPSRVGTTDGRRSSGRPASRRIRLALQSRRTTRPRPESLFYNKSSAWGSRAVGVGTSEGRE
jgi:hypothetical protein